MSTATFAGSVTLEDILEEVVGELHQRPARYVGTFIVRPTGSLVINGAISVPVLNLRHEHDVRHCAYRAAVPSGATLPDRPSSLSRDPSRQLAQ